jgi:hypothetical protein
MKLKTEIGFQITYLKESQKATLSIINTTVTVARLRLTFFCKPLFNLDINEEQFKALVYEFDMKESANTEKIVQYSTFNQLENDEY